MKRILIASPVRQKEVILKEFLTSLELLDSTGINLDFVFIDDHNPHTLLENYARDKANVRIIPGNSSDLYLCDEKTHHWREELIWKVASYKNEVNKISD